ncbi:MAG: hypothetical protein HYV52_01295 [Parcubacteria group bacterium]|nr:hypothetical protein [Parcubacteria group bacterium]
MNTTTVKIQKDKLNINKTLNSLLQEVRFLRQEITLILPRENIKEYAHPERIKNSYQKALKKYPPRLLCG